MYLTVEVSNIKEEILEVKSTQFSMSGKFGPSSTPFSVSLELYKEIDAENFKRVTSGPSVTFYFKKAESGPYWPRLTKASGKLHFVKTDFSRWKDEDEEEEESNNTPQAGGFENFDFSQFSAPQVDEGFDEDENSSDDDE